MPVRIQNSASPPIAAGLNRNSRANQRSATLAGCCARIASKLFGSMPVAAIQGAGAPTTPAASCRTAVERAGLRQPR